MDADYFEIPGGYLATIIDVLNSIDLDLSGTEEFLKLSPDELTESGYKLNAEVFRQMLLQIESNYQGERPFSLLIAEKFPITSHGALGLAILCAPNFQEAVALMQKYLMLFMPFFDVELTTQGETSALEFHSVINLEELTETLTEIVMGAFKSSRILFEKSFPTQVSFSHTPQADLKHYQSFWDCQILTAQPSNQIQFPTELLSMSLPTSNPENLKRLTGELEQKLLEESSELKVSRQVRNLLTASVDGNFPSLDDIADQLNTSPRNLSRKLTKENTSYTALLNQVRRNIAESQLKIRDKPIKLVMEQVGFASESSFNRAFKDWTGKSPSQFRQEFFQKGQKGSQRPFS